MYVDNLWVKVISLKKLSQTPLWILLGLISSFCLTLNPAWCQTPSTAAEDLDLSPEVIKNSPVLQRWQRRIPNILDEIRNDPSFPTRLRFGYSHISTNGQGGGVNLGVEDIFIGNSRLTVSGDYHTAFSGNHNSYGVNFNYYLRPLGSYVNIAPVIGYRHLEVEQYSTSGVNLGAKLLLVLSRGGGADISLTQSWIAPGTSSEAGLTSLSVGYAVTRKLRISTNIEKQNTKASQDSRLGLFLEWIVGN
ncbi:hypothetical protein [Calothrix sp. UHCC 0171]|uniref:hypothetical protein n=1 Tax=Calothrix sp. UHCC 0171 TaxID=3110245 RepID=UPI002B20F7F9|nr:hypothetical protein [Calothrix sp. UHCC 0171]MEA5569732.1 hypothetical protein [Calothrix sp. UHCC 0171]